MTRNLTIDIAKGLGILAVVLGHNEIVLHDKGELFRILFSFHMPLFFFISGVFLNAGANLRPFLAARADSLLKPFFVVMLAVCLARGLTAYLETGSAGLLGAFAKLAYGTGATIPWIPLWFLPHLFVSSTFSLLVIKALGPAGERFIPALALGLLAIGQWLMGILAGTDIPVFGHPIKAGTGLPWSIDLIPATAPFLLLGFSLRQRVTNFSFRPAGLALAIAVFFALHLFFDASIDFNQRLYGNFFVATAQALAGIHIVLSLAALLERSPPCRKVLAHLGSGSLFILIFHFYIQKDSFDWLSGNVPGSYSAAPISFILACALPLLILEAVRRNRPLRALLLPKRR